MKLFLFEEEHGQGGNAFLAEAEKQSGEVQTKESVERGMERRRRKED